MTITGIDVSHWQGLINWDLINENPDIGFVLMKGTEGNSFVDGNLERNWSLRKKPKSVYHFWRYAVDGAKQAKFYFDKVSAIVGDVKMRPAFDYEDPDAPKGANSPSALKEFHDAAQALWFGRMPFVYTRASWWDPIIGKDICGSNPLWVAHYTTGATPILPKTGGWPKYALWQYSSSGRVDGISGNVDMNRFSGTEQELWDLFYFDGGIVPPPPPSGGNWDEARVAAIEAANKALGERLDAIDNKLAAAKAAL